WGDYVPRVIDDWIDDPSGIVMVAEDDRQVVAMGRADLLTPTEAWFHGARVRPSHRGRGIAGLLAEESIDWARDSGAHVARLLIEDANESSIRHIRKTGFRRVATVIRANRAIGDATPNPDGNGGRRNPPNLAARPVKGADAPLLATGWSTSICGREVRGLIAKGWRFHTLSEVDLVEAANRGDLWEMGSSWAVTGPFDDAFDVSLLDSNEDEAYDAIRCLIDIANERGREAFWMWLADIDWLTQAARRAGCDLTPNGIWVYSL
ncbi:MAG: GNAT family N-acetyltransferase, partial [Actinomycetota bacterium]